MHTIVKVTRFYRDGFAQMRVGKRLWLLIGIKLLILFGVMKLFFFPDFLEENFNSDSARSAYLIEHLKKE
ncbi:MAG TPA: DUF4492 domain-containing protein [Epsilonproteobacteria bacterium]|nr:DUF4492 domain-containing protein [Campylobacterota bacterium]